MTYIAKCRCMAAQVSASNRGTSRSLRQNGCFDIFGISFNCGDRYRRDEDDWRRRERGAPQKPSASCTEVYLFQRSPAPKRFACVLALYLQFGESWRFLRKASGTQHNMRHLSPLAPNTLQRHNLT